jgi:hypothetical protein
MIKKASILSKYNANTGKRANIRIRSIGMFDPQVTLPIRPLASAGFSFEPSATVTDIMDVLDTNGFESRVEDFLVLL